MPPTPEPRRGEVWLVNFDPSRGEEQQKTRPAVIMSPSEVGKLKLRIVVPITTWDDRYSVLPWFVKLAAIPSNGLTKVSGADAFQVKSVSVERLSKAIGNLSPSQLDDIAAAIALSVGFRLPAG